MAGYAGFLTFPVVTRKDVQGSGGPTGVDSDGIWASINAMVHGLGIYIIILANEPACTSKCSRAMCSSVWSEWISVLQSDSRAACCFHCNLIISDVLVTLI